LSFAALSNSGFNAFQPIMDFLLFLLHEALLKDLVKKNLDIHLRGGFGTSSRNKEINQFSDLAVLLFTEKNRGIGTHVFAGATAEEIQLKRRVTNCCHRSGQLILKDPFFPFC
jgi:hypothetical protein